MRVKISTIVKVSLIILILMQFSYFKLFGEQFAIFSTSYDQYPLVVFYSVMCLGLACVGTVYAVGNRYLYSLVFMCLLASVLGIIRSGMELNESLSTGVIYIYVILAVPIYNILVREAWDFQKLLKLLLILGVGSYAFRALISYSYTLTGVLVYSNIAQESASSGWIRNDVLRINPPFIGILFVPIAYYLFSTTNRCLQKFFYFVVIIAAIGYTVQINQTRSLMIYQVLTLLILFIFERVSDRKKLIRFIILLVIIVIVINTQAFNDLIDSFSTTNKEYGGSTRARFNAIFGFGVMYLENPILGTGFLENTAQRLTVSGHLSDIGILRSVIMLGLPIIVVYLMMILRGLYVYRWAKCSRMDQEALLVLSMTALVIMTGVNIDWFVGIFGFAMPFYVAITEYVLYKAKEYEEWGYLETWEE